MRGSGSHQSKAQNSFPKFMKKLLQGAAALLLLSTLISQPSAAFAQGTAFTYQGRLNDGGAVATGNYDLKFSLFGTNSGGSAVAGPLTNAPTAVSNGLFTVTLDFGNQFDGSTRWLELGVRTNGGGNFSTLTPRQRVNATPYAINSLTAGSVNGLLISSNTNGAPNFVGGASVNYVAPGTIGAVIAGGGAVNYQGSAYTSSNSVSGNFGVVGGGQNNVVQAIYSTIGGGVNNTVLPDSSVIAGGSANAIGPAGYKSVIAGGFGNNVTAAYGAVGGGSGNNVNGQNATVAGGSGNRAGGAYSFIGGGLGNDPGYASFVVGGENNSCDANWSGIGGGLANFIETNADYSFIGAGENNRIQTFATESTISGGTSNTIQSFAYDGMIGGGNGNVIGSNAYSATISGGQYNTIVSNAYESVIGGGFGNAIVPASSNNIPHDVTISGGKSNTVAGSYSAIGGGDGNFVSGFASAIPGGHQNYVSGDYSLAAGQNAYAYNYGCFVWADAATSTPFTSTDNNQFLIRALGGVGINKNNPSTALDVAGTITAVSSTGNGVQATSSSFHGVFGSTASSIRYGVWGQNTGGGTGIYGTSTTGIGVRGDSSSGNGVVGISGGADAIRGSCSSSSYAGVYGVNTGNGTSATGVSGTSTSGYGVRGSGGNIGILAENPSSGKVVYLATPGLAGDFYGDVYVHGTVTQTSDRNAKNNFQPVEPKDVLTKISALPITSWSYKDSSDVRHIGPMAQDFYAAFAVGRDDKGIATVDEGGVALAAIQGLNQKLEETRAENAELKQSLAELKKLVQALAEKK